MSEQTQDPRDLVKPLIIVEFEDRVIELKENQETKELDMNELIPILFGTEQVGLLYVKNPTVYPYLITFLEFADPAITLDKFDPHILPQKEKAIRFTILTEVTRKRPVDTRLKLDGGYTI